MSLIIIGKTYDMISYTLVHFQQNSLVHKHAFFRQTWCFHTTFCKKIFSKTPYPKLTQSRHHFPFPPLPLSGDNLYNTWMVSYHSGNDKFLKSDGVQFLWSVLVVLQIWIILKNMHTIISSKLGRLASSLILVSFFIDIYTK